MGLLDWLIGIFVSSSEKTGENTPKLPQNSEENTEMSSFERAMEFVLLWEGGYVNHPNDPGGETKFGIAKRSHPDVDIKNLTKWEAKAIYKADYWDKIKGDQLPDAIAIAVMDYAVNSGVDRASRALQLAVKAEIDGAIGPNTISQVRAATANRGKKSVAEDIVMQRVEFLTRLVQRKPEMIAFLTGWMKRTHSLMAEVMS